MFLPRTVAESRNVGFEEVEIEPPLFASGPLHKAYILNVVLGTLFKFLAWSVNA